MTDNTPAIDFGTLALGSSNQTTSPVNLSINTNDPAGYSTSALLSRDAGDQSHPGLWDAAGKIDAGQFSIQGSGGEAPVTGDANGNFANIDTSNAPAANGSLQDHVFVTPDGSQAPGSYAGVLTYSVTPG